MFMTTTPPTSVMAYSFATTQCPPEQAAP
jgi:hypothetical protein